MRQHISWFCYFSTISTSQVMHVSHISADIFIYRMSLFIEWMRITELFFIIRDVRRTSKIWHRMELWLCRNRVFICQEQLFCHYWIGILNYFLWIIMNLFKFIWSLSVFRGIFDWFHKFLHLLFRKHKVG